MGLSLCVNCGSIEGGFKEPNEKQLAALRAEFGSYVSGSELEDLICQQCGESDGYVGVPEHDDYDLER